MHVLKWGMEKTRSGRFGFVRQQLELMLGGQATVRLLQQVGRPSGAKGHPTVLQEAALVRNACLAREDPTLAAKIGMRHRDAQTLASYLAYSSQTLREAIEAAARFHKLADPTTSLDLRRVDGEDVLVVSSALASLAANHRYQEFMVFAVLARVQSIAGRRLQPKSVVLSHPALGDVKPYGQLAGCPVEFSGGFNGIRFHDGVLDMRLSTHDPDLVAHLEALGMTQLDAQDSTRLSLKEQVERMMTAALPQRFLSADEVAGKMGMSRRTLARRLAEDGLTFRQLSNALRFDLAQAHLRDGRGVAETAFLVGYSDQATFSAAFRQQMGRSPTEYLRTGRHK